VQRDFAPWRHVNAFLTLVESHFDRTAEVQPIGSWARPASTTAELGWRIRSRLGPAPPRVAGRSTCVGTPGDLVLDLLVGVLGMALSDPSPFTCLGNPRTVTGNHLQPTRAELSYCSALDSFFGSPVIGDGPRPAEISIGERRSTSRHGRRLNPWVAGGAEGADDRHQWAAVARRRW